MPSISNDNAINFEITVAFDQRLLADEHWRNLEELDLYTPPPLPHPDSPATTDFSPALSIEYIRYIAALHFSWFKAELNERLCAYDDNDDDVSISSDDNMLSLDLDDPNAAFSPAYLSTDGLSFALNAIKSSHTTTAEHAIDSYTRRKLQQLDTWPDWKQGEISQLDKMAKLGMYGNLVRLLARQLSFVHIGNFIRSVLVIDIPVTAVMDPSVLPLHSMQSLPPIPVV